MRFLTVLVVASMAAAAQQPTSQSQEPARGDVVFSVTSTLVQIDAVVLDKKGRQVTNLGPDDFEVLVDGKPQALMHFSYVRVSPDAPPRQRSKNKPRSSQAAAALPPQHEARRDEVRRTIVLMVDDLGLSFEDMAITRRALHKFVESQMQPGDLVAVCRTAAGSGALQTFSTDKRMLMSAIDHLRWNPSGRGGIDLYTSLGLTRDGQGKDPGGADSRERRPGFERMRNSSSEVGTLAAVEHVVSALQELPGRKSVVLFSDGINLFVQPEGGGRDRLQERASDVVEALKALTDRANRSGTVIYTMDARGLPTLNLDASYSLPPGGSHGVAQVLSAEIASREREFSNTQAGLETVALLTGGLAYLNSNDLNIGLDRVLEDQKGYYLLGFRPSDDVFGRVRGQARFNRVKVKVHGAGLHVRSRTGFFGETDEQAAPKNQTPQDLLRSSMLSPFRSSEIHVRATPIYANMTKRGPLVRNLLHLDIRDLEFETQPDGSDQAHGDLLAVAAGAGDLPLAVVAKPFTISVLPGDMERARANGVVYSLDLAVANPGPYQFRMAVRDQKTGKLGSASQYMEIPDLKRVRMALTSVLLDKDVTAEESQRAVGMTPARRQFQVGEAMRYFCMLEEGRKHRALKGELDARIRVFHDEKEIYSGVATLEKTADGIQTIIGRLKLTAAIEPGEYYLQIMARSRKGKKETLAGQWTDFEVVPQGQ